MGMTSAHPPLSKLGNRAGIQPIERTPQGSVNIPIDLTGGHLKVKLAREGSAHFPDGGRAALIPLHQALKTGRAYGSRLARVYFVLGKLVSPQPALPECYEVDNLLLYPNGPRIN